MGGFEIFCSHSEKYGWDGMGWDAEPFIGEKIVLNQKHKMYFFPLSGNREILIIESALKTFQFLTCLQFVPWDGDIDKDYLHILNSKERPG